MQKWTSQHTQPPPLYDKWTMQDKEELVELIKMEIDMGDTVLSV